MHHQEASPYPIISGSHEWKMVFVCVNFNTTIAAFESESIESNLAWIYSTERKTNNERLLYTKQTFSRCVKSRPASSNSHCNRIRSDNELLFANSEFMNNKACASNPFIDAEFIIEINNLKRTDSPKTMRIVDIASRTFAAPSGSTLQTLVSNWKFKDESRMSVVY